MTRVRRRRQWAALALAVSMAAPAGLAQFGRAAHAQDAAPAAAQEAQPAKTPKELLQEGVRQFNLGEYEEAQALLQQVDPSSLSDAEKGTHADILAQAETAATQRRAARAEFEQGEAALKAKDANKAATHYRNAAQNEFADAGTQRKAREQLALAQAMGGRASEAVAEAPVEEEPPAAPRVNAKRAYNTAKAQYKKGDWINARKNFELARQAGYKPGLFEDSPATYLARMDKKEQADAARSARRAEAQARRDAEAAEAQARRDAQAAERIEAEQKQIAMAAQQPAPAPEQILQPAPQQPAPEQPAPVQPAPVQPPPPVAQQPPPQPEVRPEPPAPRTAEQDLEATARLQGVQGEQRMAEARKLVEEARRLQGEERYNDAANLYDKALQLDPTNEQARAGRAEMLTLTGRAGGGNLLQEQEERIRAQQEEIRYTFDSAITNARQAIGNNDFTAARLQLERARAARAANPQIFPPAEINRMETSIASVQEALERTEREYAQQEDARQRRETERAIQDAQAQTERERERTVASLIANSRQLINETRYTEALGVIDQILVIDPTNDYASGVRPLVEDKSILQEQRRYREDFDRNYARQLNQAEEKKIPYDDILRYPANWPDISELRDQTVAQERGEGAGDVETTKLLETRLPEVKFEAAAFEEVVNFLRDVTGANIFVNWRALEGAGIDRSAPVTARLRDVKFAKALDTILADVGGGTVTLSYTVDEGVITISTSEDLSRNTFTQVYDIRDLIISVPDFEDPPEFNLNQSTGGGRGGGGGGGSLFGGAGGQGEEEITREERIEQITQLIQETVAPDSWRDAGGIVGSVRELSGQLIVTQTPENHRQLMGLLEQLRETRAIQVTIEARFLTVQRNFLEDIGVDVDFVFNQDADLDSKFSPIPVNQETSTFTANPSTGVPGSIGNIDRSLIGTPDNPLGTSAFQLGGTYLDDFAVTFLLRATHASANSTLLTAPRLTLFNGQRAYVVVATQRAYVSDLDPVVGTRAVGFDATIDLVQSGVLLDVQATVSSDRKYVTLTLRPTLARLVELVPFPFQTAAAPTDTTGGGGDGETPPLPGEEPPVIIDPEPGIITATVQQPILEITEVRTTVSVPDGGTLLLGGQTLAGEVEREAGTPILSKIPFLKRLFTNRSMAKDEQVLLILVKPTILIQREAEQKQFPLLSTKVGQ